MLQVSYDRTGTRSCALVQGDLISISGGGQQLNSNTGDQLLVDKMEWKMEPLINGWLGHIVTASTSVHGWERY